MAKVSTLSVAQRRADADCCHRCGGLMVSEPVHELAAYDWRCVCCGERIDPVILAHRGQSPARFSDGHIGAGQRHLSLVDSASHQRYRLRNG